MSASVSSPSPHDEYLTGIIERITFHAEDTGYTVARMQVKGFKDLITLVGSFPSIQAGQTLQVQGTWYNHPKHGQQFNVKQYTETKPATLTGIEKYLGSGLIKGVGPVTASRIVKHFGLETLDMIENQLERLCEVPGIGKKRIKMIQGAWEEQKIIKEVMIFLQSHEVSTVHAAKIFKQYGGNAIAIVTEKPYQLAIDIYGIGFKTADQIARKLGVSPWEKSRYQAGLLHVLAEAAEEGHCFLPLPELVNNAIALLSEDEHQAEAEGVQEAIKQMAQTADLVVEEAEGGMKLAYKPTFFLTERNLANLLLKQLEKPVKVDLERVRNWIDRYTHSRNLHLSRLQRSAVEMAASHRIMILTGGPGCGKTFTTRTIVALWKAMGKKIGLAAPTGRAAQRLGEMAGVEAKTLHRLLEFDPKSRGFKRDKENPLPYEALIIDEASMLDLFLAHSLIKALSPETQLLLVGDVDQLPSVGPGKVLSDLIESGKIPTIKLTEVFRQAQKSAIIRVAHSINQGKLPKLDPIRDHPQSDCLWHNGGTEPEHGIQVISELITDFLPKQGINPLTDLQVLSPMTRGLVGTRNLNQVLQQLLNPPSEDKPELSRGGMTFRVGDRVIQLKNNYDYSLFNGDLGVIKEIDPVEKTVTLQVDEREIEYDCFFIDF